MTLQNMGTEIFDNISTNNALLALLKKRENIKIVSGGRKFTHPLYYQTNSSFRAYTPLEVIDTPIMEDYTRAEYDIKVVAGSLVISSVEEAKNNGQKEKLLDYAEEVRLAAEISMSEVMGDQLFGTGATTKDFDGLQQLISDTPSTQTDVGGISSTDYAYWRNQTTTTSCSAFNTASSSDGKTLMAAMLNKCVFGSKGPRAIVTTKAIYALYEIGLTAQIRYATTELADMGFLHLAYATMPLFFDDNCPDYHMYFVDLDSIWLQLLSQGNFKVTPFEMTHNQLSKTALMYVLGNLTSGQRRTSGVLTSITG